MRSIAAETLPTKQKLLELFQDIPKEVLLIFKYVLFEGLSYMLAFVPSL